MKKGTKTDYNFRVDYHDGYHVNNDFILDRDDIELLKEMAFQEGRTLKSFLAGKLKEIANIEPK